MGMTGTRAGTDVLGMATVAIQNQWQIHIKTEQNNTLQMEVLEMCFGLC